MTDQNSTTYARRALNTLVDRLEKMRALDWPLTARDDQALLALTRKHINLAEQYLEDGQPSAAMGAANVGYAALVTLGALHDLETMV